MVALVLYARRAPIDRARAAAPVYPPGNDPVGWPASGADVTYPMPPPAPPEPRQRSPLGLGTVSVALLASGLLLAADRAGVVAVGATTLLATALVVVGAGLVVGAWRGRARWLIAVGVALAIALLAALTTPRVPVAGGVGDRAFTPAALADVRPAYRLGMGNSTVDLSRVAFAGARRDVAVSSARAS
ncbi:MAG TPA: hypothetical protein VKP64_04055 [Mycobacteriales bacterium]|nr:hypothetical protein [Mycobacteriales bacterium]